MKLRTAYVLVAVCIFLLATTSAYATNLTVDCNAKKNNSIQAAIDSLSKVGPHTITVSGACTEAVLINQFYSLTLVTTTGASISYPATPVPGLSDVMTIVGSRLVRLEGFIINGGFHGIGCFAYSSCILRNLTVQGASDFAVLIGRQTGAELVQCTIQNSAGGLQLALGGAEAVVFGGSIQNITSTTDPEDPGFLGYPAVNVSLGAMLRLSASSPTDRVVIQNNTFDGVNVSTNSTLALGGNSAQITANGGNGISLDRGSVAQIGGGNQIHNSGGNGVRVGESSFAFVAGGVSFSGNTGGDVACVGTFSNAKGQSACNNP